MTSSLDDGEQLLDQRERMFRRRCKMELETGRITLAEYLDLVGGHFDDTITICNVFVGEVHIDDVLKNIFEQIDEMKTAHRKPFGP